MSLSKSSLATVREKKSVERKKELSKNDLKPIKERSNINNTSNNSYNNNSEETYLGKKISKIPRPKTGKNEKKESSSTTGNSSDSVVSSPTRFKKKDENKKIKISKKEKDDAQLMTDNMRELIAKVLKERSCEKVHSNKVKEENRAKSSSIIKMKTAPSLNVNKNQDLIKRFENEVEEISSILLNTSADLSNTLKNIKNCASLTPQALEKKNRKIQLAMKKVKSLTLLRTKNFMEEAKQLVANRELLRTEIQNVINSGKKKMLENESKVEKKFSQQTKLNLKGLKPCNCTKSQEAKIGATGDSIKLKSGLKTSEKEMIPNINVSETKKFVEEEKNEKLNSPIAIKENLNNPVANQENLNSPKEMQEHSNSPVANQENLNSPKEIQENLNSRTEIQENLNSRTEIQENLNSRSEIQENLNNREIADKKLKEVKEDSSSQLNSEELLKVVESLSAKLEKKNETINRLNNKLFELHQAFAENSLKYNDLQVKLAELCKNLQWNYILWKEIGKLKNKIKILEQNNKGLEEEKKELELSKKKLDEEIISLTKLNHVFSQQFCVNIPEAMLEFCTCGIEEAVLNKTRQNRTSLQDAEEKVLEEKQKVINQLVAIIRMMSDQENIAHKHKAEFLAKLEKLHKSQNT